ncbi:MAG: GtrA family protein [Granulosicoccus sp.]|nr:GtrA family protein [Granulosicoccus sp.]
MFDSALKYFDWVFLRFLITGCANTLCGMLTIYVCLEYASMSNIKSNVAGYAVGLVISYYMNSRFTFRFRGDWKKSALRFIMVFAVAYLANLSVVLCLIRYTSIYDYYAHWMGLPFYTVVFYLGSRLFAFRQPENAAMALEVKDHDNS